MQVTRDVDGAQKWVTFKNWTNVYSIEEPEDVAQPSKKIDINHHCSTVRDILRDM